MRSTSRTPAAPRRMRQTSPTAATPLRAVPGQPQNFVFQVTLSLDERAMKIGEAVIPLNLGMMVTAEVKTESRRVINYLFSPLANVASEALHEK
jgi:hypothetical protein